MFRFIHKWLARGAEAARKEDAESKAWLDQLRRNELSLNARRKIAPDEPVTAPHIGHGSVQPVTDVAGIAAGFPLHAPGKSGAGPDYGGDAYSDATQGLPISTAQGEAGGAFGGGGASGSFGADGADAGPSSGDSGDNT
jgi:hypothetical protein